MDSEVMVTQIKRLKEISTKLKSFSCDQSSLISIELLFFDALTVLRNMDENTGENMVHALLVVKENEYKRTQEHNRSIKAAEKAIRQFRFGFKRALDKILAANTSISSVSAN